MLPELSIEPTPLDSAGWIKITVGVLAVALALIGLFHDRAEYLKFVNSSDLLYIPSLYRDFVEPHIRMKGWHVTPAPYFVPDIPVYFALQAIFRSIERAYSAYEVVSLAAIIGVFYWIAGAATPRRRDRLLVAGLIGLAVFVLSRNPSSSYWMLVKFVLAPSAHGGGALLGLFLVGIGMRLMQRRSWVWLLVFLVVSFGGIASDKSVLSNYLVPLLVTALIAAVFRKIKFTSVLLMIVAGGLATMGALRSIDWLNGTGKLLIPDTPQYLTFGSWIQFRHDLPQFFSPSMPLCWSFAVSLIVGVAFVWRSRRTLIRERLSPGNQFAFQTAFVLLMTIGSIAGTVLSVTGFGLWANIDAVRFLMPLMLFPLVLLGLVLVYGLQRFGPAGTITVGGLLALLCIAWVTGPSTSAVTPEIFYSPTIRQFDDLVRAHNLHNGFAQYWHARPMTLENKTGVQVHQVTEQLLPDFWISNPRTWLDTSRKGVKTYLLYDFVIVNGLDRAVVLKQLGEPASIEHACELEVFIYDRAQDVMVRNLGRGSALAAIGEGIQTEPRIKTPRQLNWLRLPGSDWNTKGAQIIPVGGHLTATLDQESVCDFLELSADANDVYHVDFLDRGQVVGSVVAPAVDAIGLQPRDIDLSHVLHDNPIDALVIRPTDGDGSYSVGCVLLSGRKWGSHKH